MPDFKKKARLGNFPYRALKNKCPVQTRKKKHWALPYEVLPYRGVQEQGIPIVLTETVWSEFMWSNGACYLVKGRAQSIPERSDVGKIEKSCYLRAPKELEAHILRIRSTDEYYQHTKYERLTPSELGDRVIFRFWPCVFFEKKHTAREWNEPAL